MLDDEKCLCGSGRIYGICCKPFSGMKIEDYKRERESKNYIKAYYIAIAMLTDYLVEIKKHTNRILKDNPANWEIHTSSRYKRIIGTGRPHFLQHSGRKY